MNSESTEPKIRGKGKNNLVGDSLWKVIGRLDHLIDSTNAKAALIIAFNTFVFGGIVLKGQEILPNYQKCPNLAIFSGVILLFAAGASVLSLWMTLLAIKPYLDSHKISEKQGSLLFFNHVAERDKDGYYDEIKKISDDSLNRDLSYQIHILSVGMRKKFTLLKIATAAIYFVQLPALVLFLIAKILEFWSLH